MQATNQKPIELPPASTSSDTAVPLAAPDESGPSLGPSMPSAEHLDADQEALSEALSPYSASRATIRNLTMPPVPNFDIPPSPPGSPPLKSTKKFDRFLELKKQSIHFNAKLAESSALRNPTLFQKLMDFAGLDEQSQYVTALPDELAVPTKFPAWVYADQLNRKQEEMAKRKAEERKGKPVEFVRASGAEAASSSGGGTPSGSGRRGQGVSAAERVMAGLDRERRSPAGRGSARR